MKVLVACEFSGRTRDAFIARGHDAMSCDLLPTEAPGPHYEGDVRDLMDEQFDLVIAHPPCTYLSLSGVRWLKDNPVRQQQMEDAADFFRLMSQFKTNAYAIENPIQHRYAVEAHGLGKHTQVIHPWWFGEPERKATCLWLHNLRPLIKTNEVDIPDGYKSKYHYAPDSKGRGHRRSITPQVFADAMAQQWG